MLGYIINPPNTHTSIWLSDESEVYSAEFCYQVYK